MKMMNCTTAFRCATLCNSDTRPKTRAIQYLETTYQSLSPEEQERVDREVYGFEEPIKESPALIDSKITELREELDRYDDKKKNAFSQAMAKSAQNSNDKNGSNYITCKKFYLMFLRAEDFNAKATARRMVRYFKEKLELFGYDKLDCEIKQEDLNEQDKATLYGGTVSITGATDKAGRLIVFIRRQQLSCEPVTNLKRAVFYLLENVLQDNEETQKRGFVGVCHNMKSEGPQKIRHASQVRKLFPYFRMLIYALPIKTAATHECYNDLSYHFYLSLAIMVFPKAVIPRMICHYGTNIDCMCDLLAYGIDADSLPMTFQGDFQIEMVHKYLLWRRCLEEDDK